MGTFRADLVLQPTVVEVDGLRADLVRAANLQQFRPIQHPQLRELLAAEQLIDQQLALVGQVRDQEPRRLLGRGQGAGDVEADAAQERGVVADSAGFHAELDELGVHELVDVIVARHRLGLVLGALGQRDDRHAHGEGVEAGHDERLAALAGRHHPVAVGRDFGARLVVGHEQGEVRHVAVAAVGVFRAHRQPLLLALAVQYHRGGVDFERHRRGDLLAVAGAVGLDPLRERFGVDIAVAQLAAAGVRHLAAGFFEQQAVGGRGEVQPAPAGLARQAEMIPVGVEAEQAQPEAVLAARRAVTPPRVAPGPQEHRHHVELKADRALDFGLRHLHRHPHDLALKTHD